MKKKCIYILITLSDVKVSCNRKPRLLVICETLFAQKKKNTTADFLNIFSENNSTLTIKKNKIKYNNIK